MVSLIESILALFEVPKYTVQTEIGRELYISPPLTWVEALAVYKANSQSWGIVRLVSCHGRVVKTTHLGSS